MPVAEAKQLLQVYGKNELEEKTTSKLIIFLKLVCFCRHIPKEQNVTMSPRLTTAQCFMSLLPHDRVIVSIEAELMAGV